MGVWWGGVSRRGPNWELHPGLAPSSPPICPQFSWKISKLTHTPPHNIAPLPCSPTPGAPLAAAPAHPLNSGSSWFYTPEQMDALTALTSWLPPELPSQTCIPTFPIFSAIASPLSTPQRLAGSPPVQGPGLPRTPILLLPFPSTPP